MHKRFFNALVVTAMFIAVTTTAWAIGQTLAVQVREVPMRASPTFTGRPVATLSYGQTVSVMEEKGDWVRASSAGSTGWLHVSALTERQLSLSSGGQDMTAKAGEREVAAAGKGFNAKTERAYRQGHPDGYAQVEAMLRIQYSPKELYAFLAAGALSPGKGTGQ